MSTIIRFKLLYPDSKPPVRAVIGDAGWDLSLHDAESNYNSGSLMLKSGIAVEIPTGYFGLLRPRSSIHKTLWTMVSSGIIDSGYRGEICMPVKKLGGGNVYNQGERFAQLIILPLPDVTFVQVNELSDTLRGSGGFGSTGTK